MAIRDENEMIIESRPSALDIHELTLRESLIELGGNHTK